MASNRVPPLGSASASTSAAGVVQLTDSTSSTSTTTAATPNSVKSAYDLANGAIEKTLTTTTGDIIYASGANTPARLGIGSTGQILKVSNGLPTWAADSYAGTWTQIATGTLSGSTITVSNISAKRIAVFFKDFSFVSDGNAKLYLNNRIGSYHYFQAGRYATTSLVLTSYIGNSYSENYVGAIIDMAGSNSAFKPITVQQIWAGSPTYSIGGWFNSESNPITSVSFEGQGGWDAGTYYVWGEN